MNAMENIIKGLESLAEAGKSQQKAISLLGSTIHSQAKHIKALEDRIDILEHTLTGRDNDTLGLDDTSSDDK